MNLSRSLIAAVVLMAGCWAHGQAIYAAPREDFSNRQGLRRLEELLEQRAYSAAASQAEMLVREQGDELSEVEHGRLVSVKTTVERMCEKHRAELAPAYDELFGMKLKSMLDGLRHNEATPAEDFYALAGRNGLWTESAGALVEAGDRAARLGDFAAARCFFAEAQRMGWTVDGAHTVVVKACQEMAAAANTNVRGAPAFAAPWYARAELSGGTKVFPYVEQGRVYLAGPRHVLALKENGQIEWRFNSPEAWARASGGASQGETYVPGVLANMNGAQVLVVRQPRGVSRDHGLRALRAADGKLLWSTDAQVSLDRVAFVSVPAVCGRYVYVVAVETGELESVLSLVAMDLLSGEVIFRTVLGTLGGRREEGKRVETWWSQSEVAVDGKTVFLTPGVGHVLAVGRFDGKIQWVRKYGAIEGSDSLERRLLRYRGTPVVCGQMLVIAPKDSAWMWGLDRQDGREIWRQKDAPAGALVGAVKNHAVVAGSAVVALDAASGKRRWLYDPASVKVTGPPAIVGGTVYVPRSNGEVLALSGETGKPVEAPVKHPAFGQLLTLESVKKVLAETQMTGAFGMPNR